MKYVTIDTSTLAGLKKAEWYHAHGWKISRDYGLFTIQFYKKKS
jgi:hypothetical protein